MKFSLYFFIVFVSFISALPVARFGGIVTGIKNGVRGAGHAVVTGGKTMINGVRNAGDAVKKATWNRRKGIGRGRRATQTTWGTRRGGIGRGRQTTRNIREAIGRGGKATRKTLGSFSKRVESFLRGSLELFTQLSLPI